MTEFILIRGACTSRGSVGTLTGIRGLGVGAGRDDKHGDAISDTAALVSWHCEAGSAARPAVLFDPGAF